MAAELDLALLHLGNRLAANTAFDWLMPRITNLHQSPVFLVAVVLFSIGVFCRAEGRARWMLLAAILAIAVSDAVAYRGIKSVYKRPRPCHRVAGSFALAVPDVRLPSSLGCPGSPSFPSNHASNTMAAAIVAVLATRGRKRFLWLLLPLAIGYSRVYLGFHYVSDVLGGWALGAALGAGMVALVSRVTGARPSAPQAPAAEP